MRIIERVAPEWEDLAACIGFEEARIKTIRRGTFFQPEEACMKMFTRWLNGEHDLKPPTWYNLMKCLEQSSNFGFLAHEVRELIMLRRGKCQTDKHHSRSILHFSDFCINFQILYTIIIALCHNIISPGDRPRWDQLCLLKPGDGCEVKIVDTVGCSDWSKLANALGFSATTQEAENDCKNMLNQWLLGGENLKPATWDCLIRCLKDAGFLNLAGEIEKFML